MCYLIGFITGKHSLRSLYDEPVRKEYRKLQVDTMPVIDSFERLNYVELLKEYLDEFGKPLKPIKRHKNSLPVSNKIVCPKCGAPHFYIYRNNGKSKNIQYMCKICEFTFGSRTDYLKNVVLRCPHCKRALEPIKSVRILMFPSAKTMNVPFYLSNLKNLLKSV